MSSGDGPRLFEVSVSGWARDRLLELADAATRQGDGEAFVAALREFHRRLQIYPQFGDPLVDLIREVGHIRLGSCRRWPCGTGCLRSGDWSS